MTPDDDAPRPQIDETLEELVASCLERLEKEGWSSVSRFCSEHPANADAIRKRLGALAEMGLLPSVGENAPNEFPERLGEFRLLKRLGGGGMGVVFLATQEGLNRPVALKVIRPEHLYFPGARERFRREVETVAKLEHPGIVQVHTVGEENGLPFFAMERVIGASLAELMHDLRASTPDGGVEKLGGKDLLAALRARLKDEPPGSFAPEADVFARGWVESCFRIVRQAALALDHAHERGVMHRDVKPSNLMLCPDGRVRVLDFGLATTAGESRLTRTGTQLGSLPYMAPEQLNAQAVDRRTDIYALGVVLFEMLGLTLPHTGETAEIVMRSILSGTSERLRELNPSVTRDAETVCLTALDPEPARRYPTAADFAADLLNVVELRPILARRASAIERVRRFAQRHPAASTAIALAVLLVVGGPTLFAIQQHNASVREATLRARAEEAGAREADLRERAETNFRRALSAVDQMLVDVGDNLLDDVPQMERARKRLLERARDFFTSLHPEEARDPEARQDAISAYARLANVLESLGDRKGARETIDTMLVASDQLGETLWTNTELLMRVVESRIALSRINQEEGRMPEADAALSRALADLARLDEAKVPGVLVERMRAYFQLGQLRVAMGREADAEQAFKEVFATGDRATPEQHTHVVDEILAQGWNDLGLMLMGHGNEPGPRRDDALAAFNKASEIAARTMTENAVPLQRSFVATIRMNLGGFYRRTNRPDDAEREYRFAAPIQDELHAQFPESERYAMEAAAVHNNLGLIFEGRKQLPEAEAEYRLAIERLTELHARAPGSASVEERLGVAWMNLSMIARMAGDIAEEEKRLTTAESWVARALARNPSDSDLVRLVLTLEWARAGALIDQGRLEAAADRAEAYASMPPAEWLQSYRGAEKIVAAIAHAERDIDLADAERERIVAALAPRAVALIRRAVEKGFDRGAEALEKDEDVALLRDRADFQEVVRELERRDAERAASRPAAGDK